MNIESLEDNFSGSGLSLIKVEDFDKFDGLTMVFDGDLIDYIKAVKVLDNTVVFINICYLEEYYFSTEVELDGADNEEIDLSSTSPEIMDYKKYIGKSAHYHFLAISSRGNLEFHFQEAWWNELLDLLIEEKERIKNEYIVKFELKNKEKEKHRKSLLKKLDNLKDEQKFMQCRTQKVKLAYALEKYPELSELEPSLIKRIVAELDAHIEARMLNED